MQNPLIPKKPDSVFEVVGLHPLKVPRYAFLNGTGVGQPLGLFAATGGGTVYKTVTKLTADDIMNLVYRQSKKHTFRIVTDLLIYLDLHINTIPS